MYVINQIFDISIYKREPTFSVQRYLGSTLLDPNYVMVDEIELERNIIDSEEDFI